MPRVRLTARGCSALAVLAAGVCTAAAALAAPPAGGTPVRPAETDARRRDEVEAAQRQDIAESLKKHFNIDVDWRTMPLEKLVDVRVRAAKAAELQQRLGVSVDWQRYSWIELEALRRTLINFERYRGEHTGAAATPVAVAAAPASPRPAPDDDGVLPPTFKGRPLAKAGRATEPDGVIRPTFTGRPAAPGKARDPDGVMRPTFAVRPRLSPAEPDPDGLIAPTFAPFRRASRMADADGLLDPGRPDESRPAPSRW